MGRTPLSNSTNFANSQNKNKSISSISKKSSSSSSGRTRISHTNDVRRTSIIKAANKENTNTISKSTSDISEDEQMECETVWQNKPRRTAAVHEFSTKLSAQEYRCKLCAKVKVHQFYLNFLK